MSRLFLGAFFVAFTAAAYWPAVWALDNTPPVEFLSARVEPDSSPVGLNVMTFYRVNVLRGSDQCSIEAARSWTDAHGNQWPAMAAPLKYGTGPTDINLSMAVPRDAWAGVATIDNAIVYACNPLQRLWPRRVAMPTLSVVVQR